MNVRSVHKSIIKNNWHQVRGTTGRVITIAAKELWEVDASGLLEIDTSKTYILFVHGMFEFVYSSTQKLLT